MVIMKNDKPMLEGKLGDPSFESQEDKVFKPAEFPQEIVEPLPEEKEDVFATQEVLSHENPADNEPDAQDSPEDVVAEAVAETSSFLEGEDVSWKGERGWRVTSVPEHGGDIIEIGKIKRNRLGREVFVREIIQNASHNQELQRVGSEQLHEGQKVGYKGKKDWKIDRLGRPGTRLIQIGRMQRHRLLPWRKEWRTEIVDRNDIEIL